MEMKMRMRRRLGRRATFAGVGVAAVATLAVLVGNASGTGRVLDPTVVTERQIPTNSTSIVLDPVPAGYEPTIDSEQAVDLSLAASPVDATAADSVSPTLAIVTNTQSHDVKTGELTLDHVPAWVVSLDGVCVPVLGAGSIEGSDSSFSADDCAGSQVNVIIDAESGDFIEAFSDM
jgi:hypothetical protein